MKHPRPIADSGSVQETEPWSDTHARIGALPVATSPPDKRSGRRRRMSKPLCKVGRKAVAIVSCDYQLPGHLGNPLWVALINRKYENHSVDRVSASCFRTHASRPTGDSVGFALYSDMAWRDHHAGNVGFLDTSHLRSYPDLPEPLRRRGIGVHPFGLFRITSIWADGKLADESFGLPDSFRSRPSNRYFCRPRKTPSELERSSRGNTLAGASQRRTRQKSAL